MDGRLEHWENQIDEMQELRQAVHVRRNPTQARADKALYVDVQMLEYIKSYVS